MSDRLFSIIIGSIILVIGAACALFFLTVRYKHPPAPVSSVPVQPAIPSQPVQQDSQPLASLPVALGKNAVLHNGADEVDVAVTQQTLIQLVQAAMDNDRAKYNAIFKAKKAFRTPDGSEVELIGEGLDSANISLLDGKHKGRRGWVLQEWVTKN